MPPLKMLEVYMTNNIVFFKRSYSKFAMFIILIGLV